MPGATLPVVELIQSVCGLLGLSEVPLAALRNTAAGVAYQSLVFTIMSFIATVMAMDSTRQRLYRWLIWLPPVVALVGSLSFWLSMASLTLGS